MSSPGLSKPAYLPFSTISLHSVGTKPPIGAPNTPSMLFAVRTPMRSDSSQKMHRARMVNNGASDFDWYHPLIRFVRVPRSSVLLLGYMEEISLSLAQKAADYAGRCLPPTNGSVFLPVHELQVDNILTKFPDVEVLQDICVPGLAQSSIRFVLRHAFSCFTKYVFKLGRSSFLIFQGWL
jgi:hypothetical protein